LKLLVWIKYTVLIGIVWKSRVTNHRQKRPNFGRMFVRVCGQHFKRKRTIFPGRKTKLRRDKADLRTLTRKKKNVLLRGGFLNVVRTLAQTFYQSSGAFGDDLFADARFVFL
jgi:hypothetical protein